jgi:hypothetical protein
MTRSNRLIVPIVLMSLALAACQAAPSATAVPTTAVAPSTGVPAPSPTAGPDTAALLAAQYDQLKSGEVRMAGTLRIGSVEATFTGLIHSNGPDQSTTMTTTIGSQSSTEQHVRVAGTRYVQRGTGPWLVDATADGAGSVSPMLKDALHAATDLDSDAGPATNHRLEAADQSFDPVAAGFATAGTPGRATYLFIAKPDGTPVSVSVTATWTQPGERGSVKADLDIVMTFSGLNTKPRITAPASVWQSFSSARWGYSVAYPGDYDYTKDKAADYFIGPANDLVSIQRQDADGYTLNQVAASELAATRETLRSKSATNEAIAIGGTKARLLTVAGTYDGRKVVTFMAIAVHGKYAFAILWFADAGGEAAQLATFRQLLSTFQLA